MKIVHIEDFFHPDAGYQLNIIAKYMVMAGHEVTIITGESDKVPDSLTAFFGADDLPKRDAAYSQQYGVKIVRLPLRGYISNRAVFSSELYHVIRAEQPDVVYVHGNDTLTGMRYLLRRKQMGYPLIMDSHMLEMASRNRFSKGYHEFYKKFFTPMLIKDHITVIRTQDDPYVEKCLGIPLAQAPWISVGSDTILFHPDEDVKKEFRKKYSIPQNAFVIMYAGKLDEAKGGLLLAETLKEPFQTKRPFVALVIGKTQNNEYGHKVEEALSASKNMVLRFPTQKYVDLPPFYQAADLAVFPRQCSLSFYDVQACGLPVVFEENSVNVTRSKFNSALLFKENNILDFREKIKAIADAEPEQYQKMSDNAVMLIKTTYDYKTIVDEYLREIEKSVVNFKR